jgi:fibro-slime domain-containing protein
MNFQRFLTSSVVAASAALSIFAAVPAMAASFTLTGTVRDFNDTHPDFEQAIASEKGIVENQLGTDGKPVYAKDGQPSATTTGKANFDQWFRNVPGVNQTGSYSFTATDDDGDGIYNYVDNAFFIIDNQLLGNQGRDRNYHFTYQIAASFVYNPGQTFAFTGDDDIWVYINDQLVIDLGGVHKAETGMVDLDSLGLIAGKRYNFDMFYAERHTSESTFNMTSSFLLQDRDENVPSVPEPMTVTGAILAGGFVAAMKRRRKQLAA